MQVERRERRGVRVNAVAPSLAMHPHLAKVTSAGLLEELTAREAFGRYAEPWEVANVVVSRVTGRAGRTTMDACLRRRRTR